VAAGRCTRLRPQRFRPKRGVFLSDNDSQQPFQFVDAHRRIERSGLMRVEKEKRGDRSTLERQVGCRRVGPVGRLIAAMRASNGPRRHCQRDPRSRRLGVVGNAELERVFVGHSRRS